MLYLREQKATRHCGCDKGWKWPQARAQPFGALAGGGAVTVAL